MNSKSSLTLQCGGVALEIAALTDLGLVRKNNEDTLIVSDENGLFGVCDGMGGHAAGEIASSLASKTLTAEVGKDRSDPQESLRNGLETANAEIFKVQATRPEYRGMGTTVSAILISSGGEGKSWIVHVGDSRIYRKNRDNLSQLTTDHSPVFRLYQQGMLSREQMRSHPHKNLLDRSLGVTPTVEPDVFETPIRTGDLFLICTDGLTDELTDREILEILSEGDVTAIADRLLSQAKATGGRDNISLIVLKVLEIQE